MPRAALHSGGVLFDDYILRQVQKVAELVAAVARKASGQPVEEHEVDDQQVAEAYRALGGLDGELVLALTAGSVVANLGDDDSALALVELLTAHGDLRHLRGDEDGARRRWDKALAVLAEVGGDEEAEAAIWERLRRI